MKTTQDRSRWLNGLSWVMYGLAAVILVASILIGLSVSGAAAVVPAATIGLQAPVFKPVWDALVSGLELLGVIVFAGGFVLSLLVFGVGILLAHIVRLDRRICALEETLLSHEHVVKLSDRPKTALSAPFESRSAA